jgi:hypothetical protein
VIDRPLHTLGRPGDPTCSVALGSRLAGLRPYQFRSAVLDDDFADPPIRSFHVGGRLRVSLLDALALADGDSAKGGD